MVYADGLTFAIALIAIPIIVFLVIVIPPRAAKMGIKPFHIVVFSALLTYVGFIIWVWSQDGLGNAIGFAIGFAIYLSIILGPIITYYYYDKNRDANRDKNKKVNYTRY